MLNNNEFKSFFNQYKDSNSFLSKLEDMIQESLNTDENDKELKLSLDNEFITLNHLFRELKRISLYVNDGIDLYNKNTEFWNNKDIDDELNVNNPMSDFNIDDFDISMRLNDKIILSKYVHKGILFEQVWFVDIKSKTLARKIAITQLGNMIVNFIKNAKQYNNN